MSYNSRVLLFVVLFLILGALHSCGQMLGIIDDPEDKKERTKVSEEYRRKEEEFSVKDELKDELKDTVVENIGESLADSGNKRDTSRDSRSNSSSVKITGALNAKDLSLGTLTMGDRAEKVTQELGRPVSTTTDSDGGKRLKYNDAEVVVKNGKISALVSQSSAFATARGIHEGSTAQEVFDRYGTDYVKTSYDSQTLYEYSITSADGHPCWLRFAVNNSDGRVAYISERVVQSEIAPTGNSTGNSAEQTFRNYHKAITNGNYREAYEILSYKQRERVGNFDSYVARFSNTISSEVTDLRQVSSDADSCTFDYTLTARDRSQGRIKVATFKGQVTMAKDNGKWYVRYAKSDKVNERYE